MLTVSGIQDRDSSNQVAAPQTARPWDRLVVLGGMMKDVIYVCIKLRKETMDFIRFICWIVLICTVAKIFRGLYFWCN